MPIQVTCSCGATAMVKDEYAGRTGQCRACKGPVTVPFPAETIPQPPPPPTRDMAQPTIERMAPAPTPPAPSAPEASVDPLFDRDRFFLRQKHLAINEKYAVWSDDGQPIMFVERPAHLFRNLMALAAGLVSGGALFSLLGFTYQAVPDSLQSGYLIAGALLATLAIITVYVRLELKRHVSFFRDESKRVRVLAVKQDKKFELLTATYTVADAKGNLLGTFSKNYLYDLLRKRWECRDRRGNLLFVAREDSIIKSILRRFLGPLFGLLRLNFVFCDPLTGDVLGEFNRSFTIQDRYVLDMEQDAGHRVDRRLALAMGVMLDTGEKR